MEKMTSSIAQTAGIDISKDHLAAVRTPAKNAIMHLTDSGPYVIVMAKEIDHDTRRIKQPDLS
jgi:hypothetical protein